MTRPAVCERFIMDESEWKKGRVERTKRKLRDFLESVKQGLRGAIVVLAYDSDDINDRVRIAAKQVG